ncbi:ribosome-associated translation inhibitor RaiA [Candidatus Saccharibacteria bacterium]|nr:ribosome-associated translation inhibitor RaiA [Candidatus Saccharibacteria bacterium]
MIKKLEITGIRTTLDNDLKKYARSKIGKLDKYIPRNSRESAHAEIILKESKIKTKKVCTCEVILYLPHEQLTTKESTINMYAAIDIVEAKLKNQIKKYKDTHGTRGLHRRVISKFMRNQ